MGYELGSSNPNQPERARLDGDAVGIFFITGCALWTALITGGMAFLWIKRRMPFLRIRHLAITFTATIFLHLYWISVQIGYTVGPLVPEEIEYWFMGILYPVGLGLFFYGNAELLRVAKLQKQYLESGGGSDIVTLNGRLLGNPPPKNALSRAWRQFQQLDFAFRALLVVGSGMLFQIFLTVLMFLVSRKFHSTWGIPGTEVHGQGVERKIQQGRGWEWWPAIVWQIFWSWIVAPIILWQARGIKDTHGWRLQTVVCCLASLPATPMWLIALYVPGMDPANNYWIPAQWIGISVWFIEAFTVWIPCYQVFRHQTLQQETLDAIALWEARTKSGTTTCSGTTHVPRSVADTYKTLDSVEAAKEKNGDGFEKSSIESIYTISALEHTLNQNPEPLRKFAALRDFSGENIAFLIGVREWKSMWPESGSPPDKFDQFEGPSRRQLFKRAVHVYANYVSPLYAEFPINISSRDLRNLDALFLEAARVLYGDSRRSSLSDATPFSDSSGKSMYGESEGQAARRSMRGEDSETNLVDLIAEKVQYWGEIPKEFSKTAFDDAEMSIKYLVLTNTWPKFLKERREKQSAQSSSESSTSSRVTKYFKGLISASIRSKASL